MRHDASVSGVSLLDSISVATAHNTPSATATVAAGSHTLQIGDAITVQIGYDGSLTKVFSGYVKRIEQKVPNGLYTITAQDEMIKAIEYFIASTTPETPLSYSNTSAEDLVHDLMDLAGCDGTFYHDTTYFTFGITSPVEVNLIAAYDFSKQIADILAYDLWADENGALYFKNRRPYVMGGDSAIAAIDDTTTHNIINFTYRASDRDLRNKVVVYGRTGIVASAEAESPYLPAGFRKAVVVASQWIEDQSMAQDAADYNLDKLNRLTEEASAEVIGDPVLMARKVITVDESYTGENSEYYIYSCEHRWGASGYTTLMELRK